MPLLKNRMLPLSTITQTCVVRNTSRFWKEEWNLELEKITEASDDILMNLRKSYLNMMPIKIRYFELYTIDINTQLFV